MAKSIMQSEKRCYITHSTLNLECHHVIGGCFRDKSEKYGLTVWLTHEMHTGSKEAVHNNIFLMRELRKEAQKVFEQKYSHELFMKEFKYDYLAGEDFEN